MNASPRGLTLASDFGKLDDDKIPLTDSQNVVDDCRLCEVVRFLSHQWRLYKSCAILVASILVRRPHLVAGDGKTGEPGLFAC